MKVTRRKPKINHGNAEQHVFSRRLYSKCLPTSLEYYAIVSVFLCLLVLKTPLFHITEYITNLNVAYKNNINLIFPVP